MVCGGAAFVGANALVICTEWKNFRAVDLAWLKGQLSSPILVDGRNHYDPERLSEVGFEYYGVGRGKFN